MRTMLTVMLTGALVLTLAAGASAAVAWNGSGSPADVGYTLGGSMDFSLDTPPGFMHQDSTGAHLARWLLDDDKMAAEMVWANGWIVETRLKVISGAGWGLYMFANDDVGGVPILLGPDAIIAYGAGWEANTVAITEGEYHTIRVERAAGGTLCDVYVDDVLKVSTAGPGYDPGGPVGFGDGCSSNSGEASWDYFVINPIPEPTSLVLLVAALLSLLVWRRR